MKSERKLVTIEKAIEALDRSLEWNAEVNGKHAYSKGYIYNLISKGEIKNHGKAYKVLVDENEVVARLVG